MRFDGVRCDRCDKRELLNTDGKLPAGWGVVRFQRPAPFLDTGTLDLCVDCFEQGYQRTRRIP